MKADFLRDLADQFFEGLTPSQALAKVISILQSVFDQRIPIDQLEFSATHQTTDQLVALVESQLPMSSIDADALPSSSKGMGSHSHDQV